MLGLKALILVVAVNTIRNVPSRCCLGSNYELTIARYIPKEKLENLKNLKIYGIIVRLYGQISQKYCNYWMRNLQIKVKFFRENCLEILNACYFA